MCSSLGQQIKSWLSLSLAASFLLQTTSHADELIKAEWRGNGESQRSAYVFARSSNVPDAQSVSVALDGVESTVVFPEGATGFSLERVELYGSFGPNDQKPMIGWAYTKGSLRVRATVRYGWFDGFEGNDGDKPNLEIFVNGDSMTRLPYLQHNTPGEVDEFQVANERQVLKALFSQKELKLVRKKGTQFIERDSALLLEGINFGNECGIRYRANVKSAVPWKNANVVEKSEGWVAHC